MAAGDVEPGRILVAAGAIAATVVLGVAAVFVLLQRWDLAPGTEAPRRVGPLQGTTPPLSIAPQDELAAYRREQAQRLGTLAWADRERRLVRVPIDAAIALRAQSAASEPPR